MAFHIESVGTTSPVAKKALRSLGLELDDYQLHKDILSKYGSIDCLKAEAKHGQNEAQYFLAMAYEYGIPELYFKEDIDKAIYWYETCHKSDIWVLVDGPQMW